MSKELEEALNAMERAVNRSTMRTKSLRKRQQGLAKARQDVHLAAQNMKQEQPEQPDTGGDGDDSTQHEYKAGVHTGLVIALEAVQELYHTTRQPKCAEAIRTKMTEWFGEVGESHPDTGSEPVVDGEPVTKDGED